MEGGDVDYMGFYDERLSNCLFFDLVEVKKIGEYGGGGSDLWSSKTMFLLTRIFQCCFWIVSFPKQRLCEYIKILHVPAVVV